MYNSLVRQHVVRVLSYKPLLKIVCQYYYNVWVKNQKCQSYDIWQTLYLHQNLRQKRIEKQLFFYNYMFNMIKIKLLTIIAVLTYFPTSIPMEVQNWLLYQQDHDVEVLTAQLFDTVMLFHQSWIIPMGYGLEQNHQRLQKNFRLLDKQ